MNKLLILTPDAEEYLPLIEAAGLPQLSLFCATETDGSADLIASCNIFLAEPCLASTVLEAASQLEWLQSTWAGVDSLCQTGMRRDYSLTGLRDIFGPLIAEYVMAYLFSLERRIFQMHLFYILPSTEVTRY